MAVEQLLWSAYREQNYWQNLLENRAAGRDVGHLGSTAAATAAVVVVVVKAVDPAAEDRSACVCVDNPIESPGRRRRADDAAER